MKMHYVLRFVDNDWTITAVSTELGIASNLVVAVMCDQASVNELPK